MGWSTKQPISSMDPTYSPEIENWFPNGNTVDLRKGYRKFATTGGQSGTLGEYTSEAGITYFVAGSGTDLYSIDTTGTTSDIDGGATAANEFSWVNFKGRIILVYEGGGSDVYHWTGTGNIAASAFVGPAGDDKALRKVTSYKNRLYFSEYSAASVWYAGLDAVTGALTEFDLTSIFRKGGDIWFIGSISSTANNSQEEYFVIISRMGEIVLYQGDNPSAATWSKVGHYFCSPPVGSRSFFYWGNDIVIITWEGALSLLSVMGAGADQTYAYLTDEIQGAYKDLIDHSGTTTEYVSGIHYAKGNQLIINIHNKDTTHVVYQLVMNTKTGAWTKFTNQQVFFFGILNGNLYFSYNLKNHIYRADYNASGAAAFDEDPDNAGQALTRTTKLRHAVNYFGDSRNNKQFVDARPIFLGSRAAGNISLASGVDIDYANTTQTSTQTYPSGTSTEALYKEKCGLAGTGKAASYRIDAVTADTLKLQATEIFYNEGDVS